MATKQLKLYFWEGLLDSVGGKYSIPGYMFALAYSLREARALLKKQLKSDGQWGKIAERDLATKPEVIVSPLAGYKLGQHGD